MPLQKDLVIGFCCCLSYFICQKNAIAQSCGGSWNLQRPLTIQCVAGQWIGWQNSGNPSGCPVNPTYSGVETNTFTFTNPVNSFFIDFRGFDGSIGCPRIEIKINGIFYPLTASNLIDFPLGTTCTTGSINYMTVTTDGYLTVSPLGGSGFSGQGRITISNNNTTSVTVSTNDGNGTVFSDPFNCTTVPLKLENFIGQNSDCRTLLKWKTGTEFNIKNIEIEKSKNGVLFAKVGVVSPKGSDSYYSFDAVDISDGVSDAYFRLKFNDLDGHYEYSKIIHVKTSCNNPNYSIIPNPAYTEVEILGISKIDKIVVTDILGRIITRLTSAGGNKFNVQSLRSGIYILKAYNSGMHKACIKLIKN